MIEKMLDSLKKNRIGILLILAASISTAFGQFFWKYSEGHINGSLILGFFLYFIGAVLMIIAFRFGSLSVLHPLLSMGYVFAMLIGTILLDESLSTHHIIGNAFIIIGALLLGGGDD